MTIQPPRTEPVRLSTGHKTLCPAQAAGSPPLPSCLSPKADSPFSHRMVSFWQIHLQGICLGFKTAFLWKVTLQTFRLGFGCFLNPCQHLLRGVFIAWEGSGEDSPAPPRPAHQDRNFPRGSRLSTQRQEQRGWPRGKPPEPAGAFSRLPRPA